jgi:hypothetical protein
MEQLRYDSDAEQGRQKQGNVVEHLAGSRPCRGVLFAVAPSDGAPNGAL